MQPGHSFDLFQEGEPRIGVVIGTGPSLTGEQIAKVAHLKRFGANRAFEFDVDVLHGCNWQFWEHYWPQIKDLRCHKGTTRPELEGKNIDRRSDKRVNLSGTVLFQLLDKSGKPLGKGYKGELSDLSAGGISFIIKSSKKETVRMLLGRRLKVSFKLPMKHNAYHNIEQLMTVIAAQPQVFDDYSIHLKFDTKWAQKMVEDIDASREAVKPDQA